MNEPETERFQRYAEDTINLAVTGIEIPLTQDDADQRHDDQQRPKRALKPTRFGLGVGRAG
jgi:hypothetical protein